MHIYLSDDDISQMPKSLRHPLLDWLKIKNSRLDAGIAKRAIAVRAKRKRKEDKKKGCNYINSPKISRNDWKCERWNLSGWSVTRLR